MKVFIAGPRAISKLNSEVKSRLRSIMEKNITVLIGDANGVDKAIQKFLFESTYENVIIYSCAGKIRNNIGTWEVENIKVKKGLRGFDLYQQKDIAMAKDADYGFMIWNGASKGTLNNIVNLIRFTKKVLVYFLPEKQFVTLTQTTELNELLIRCPKETQDLYDDILKKMPSGNTQLSLFDLSEENE